MNIDKITHHASRITHHASRITHHASRITHHASRIISLFVRVFYYLKRKIYLFQQEASRNSGKYIFSHVTAYYVGNAGDTVLSKCVRDCFNKFFAINRWKIISVSQKVTHKTITNLNNTNMLIIGGGGLFLPDTNPNDVSGWQWAISTENLSQINIPLVVFSVGYNYFHTQEQSELFKRSVTALVGKSSFFGLRNHGSVRAIRRILPDNLKERIIFQPCITTVSRKLYGNMIPAKSSEDSKCVAINMAFDRSSMRFGEHEETILHNVATAVKSIEEKGYKIFYVCHCGGDISFLPYLRAHDVSFKVADFSKSLTKPLIEFYNKMAVVLGMRGHSQMIPFGVNTEILSLGTHDKMLWFLEDIEASDWYVDLTANVDNLSEAIVNKFTYIHEENHEETRARLIIQQDKLWSITQDNMRTIGKLLVQ